MKMGMKFFNIIMAIAAIASAGIAIFYIQEMRRVRKDIGFVKKHYGDSKDDDDDDDDDEDCKTSDTLPDTFKSQEIGIIISLVVVCLLSIGYLAMTIRKNKAAISASTQGLAQAGKTVVTQIKQKMTKPRVQPPAVAE